MQVKLSGVACYNYDKTLYPPPHPTIHPTNRGMKPDAGVLPKLSPWVEWVERVEVYVCKRLDLTFNRGALLGYSL
jgi:hypothetical protein